MHKDDTSLSQQIESKEYFQKALSWYADKYLAPHPQLVSMLIMSILSCLATYWICESLIAKSQLTQYPFTKYVEDQVNFTTHIKSISVGTESIDRSVARHLISNYIVNYEKYQFIDITPETIQEKISGIKANSSRKVFAQYLQNLDVQRNPNSPILKYKLQTDRIINVISVDFPTNTPRPKSALAIFKATERKGTNSTESYWSANINFSLNNIVNVLDYNSPLNFIVTNYTVEKKSS